MDSKLNLRVKAKELRKKLNIEKISKQLITDIRNLQIYQSAKNIMIYYPMKYEVNLLDLTKDKKNFYLPKVNGNELFVCPYNCDLKKSELNIYEPCSEPVNPEILDLIIVPALMVDKQKNRLGYGGGFYDRFLAKYPYINSLLPIAKELIIDKLPNDVWDMKVKKIIAR